MKSDEVIVHAIRALNATDLSYMITGSLASNFYGRSRSTKGADFIIELGERSIDDIVCRLGEGFELDPQMSFETITGSLRHRVVHTSSAFVLEFFLLSSDPFAQERFRRRRQVVVEGVPAFQPTAEDVIVQKLRWCRNRGRGHDMDDARYVLALQRDRLDWPYIESWCDRHGTREVLEQLRRETQPPVE